MKSKDNNILVSVPVITYNSEKTVVETLDSIYNQTYPYIELIISDDCSTDNTINICNQWICKHKGRFSKVNVISYAKNTGVSANCNRAYAACHGEWIKVIAGDDLLIDTCIEDFLSYIEININAEFVFSRVLAFGPNIELNNVYNDGVSIFDYSFFLKNSKEQLYSIIYENAHIPAPSAFIRNGAYDKYGVINDERIPLIEDEPKWINLLSNGANFNFLDKVTVMYRVGELNSITAGNNILSPLKFDSSIRVYLYYKFSIQLKDNKETAYDNLINFINRLYRDAYYGDSLGVYNSMSYKIGNILIRPFKEIKRIFKKY